MSLPCNSPEGRRSQFTLDLNTGNDIVFLPSSLTVEDGKDRLCRNDGKELSLPRYSPEGRRSQFPLDLNTGYDVAFLPSSLTVVNEKIGYAETTIRNCHCHVIAQKGVGLNFH